MGEVIEPITGTAAGRRHLVRFPHASGTSTDAAHPAGEGNAADGEGNDPAKLRQTISDLNRQLKIFDRVLDIHVDPETDEVVVKVVNTETGETVRQIPPDQVLRAARLMNELRGLLVDNRA